MSEFLNNLGKIGMVLQAGGGSLAGRDGMAVVRDWEKQQQEEQKRKVVADILAGSGIGGPQRALLEQMPTADAIPTALQMMAQMEAQRRAAASAGAAEARKAAEQRQLMEAYGQYFGGGQPAPSAGGFSLGERVTDVMPPSQPLSFGQPSAMPSAMPAPPPSAMPMSFGQVATQPAAAPSPYEGARATYERLLRMPPPPPGTPQRKAYDDAVAHYERQVEFFAPPETSGPGNDYERYVAREIARGTPPDRIPDEFTYREMVAAATSGESQRETRIAELRDDLIEQGMEPAQADIRARGMVEGRYQVNDGIVFDTGFGDVDGLNRVNPLAPSGQPGLYDRAPQATGAIARGAQVSSDTLGQLPIIGGIFNFPDQVQAASAFRIAQNDLIRSLSINPRFPVAEMERIRTELGFDPAVFSSPRATQSRMIELDRYLKNRIEIEADFANAQGNPISERNAAARAVRDMVRFREILGVPQGEIDISEADRALIEKYLQP